MFNEIGKKMKQLAQVIFWLEAIAAVTAGLAFVEITDGFSLLLALVGILVAWISSWFLYGFGEIIDKLCAIERNTRPSEKKAEANPMKTPTTNDAKRAAELEELRAQGLITETEFQQALAKHE